MDEATGMNGHAPTDGASDVVVYSPEHEKTNPGYIRLNVLGSLVPARVIRYHLGRNGETQLVPFSEEYSCAVLFADISGFSSLAEKLAKDLNCAANAAENLSTYIGNSLERMVEAVCSKGGDVIKFAGDAILAIFPTDKFNDSLEEATLCCVKVALDLLGLELRAGGVELSVHCGVGAGKIVSYHVGGLHDRWEYVVTGDPVDQIGSAEPEANAGEVVIAKTAYKIIAGHCEGVTLESGNFRIEKLKSIRENRDHELVFAEFSPLLHDPSELERMQHILRSYVPRPVLQAIDSGQSLWFSELRLCSTLFCRLKGLQFNSVDNLSLIQQAMLTVQEQIYLYEGTLCRFIVDDKGAGLLLAFGLPPYMHENDPVRAVKSAMEIHTQIQKLRNNDGESLSASIGVTSGRVFCGTTGGRIRCEYTLHGTLVNLAARYMVAAKDGVLCGEITYKESKQYVDFQKAMKLKVKGKSETVLVYRPVGAKDLHGFDKESTKSLQKIVGRKYELGIMEQAFRKLATKNQHSEIIVLSGDAGIGKSILLQHSYKKAQKMKLNALIGIGVDTENSTPLFVFKSILSQMVPLYYKKIIRLRFRNWLQNKAPNQPNAGHAWFPGGVNGGGPLGIAGHHQPNGGGGGANNDHGTTANNHNNHHHHGISVEQKEGPGSPTTQQPGSPTPSLPFGQTVHTQKMIDDLCPGLGEAFFETLDKLVESKDKVKMDESSEQLLRYMGFTDAPIEDLVANHVYDPPGFDKLPNSTKLEVLMAMIPEKKGGNVSLKEMYPLLASLIPKLVDVKDNDTTAKMKKEVRAENQILLIKEIICSLVESLEVVRKYNSMIQRNQKRMSKAMSTLGIEENNATANGNHHVPGKDSTTSKGSVKSVPAHKGRYSLTQSNSGQFTMGDNSSNSIAPSRQSIGMRTSSNSNSGASVDTLPSGNGGRRLSANTGSTTSESPGAPLTNMDLIEEESGSHRVDSGAEQTNAGNSNGNANGNSISNSNASNHSKTMNSSHSSNHHSHSNKPEHASGKKLTPQQSYTMRVESRKLNGAGNDASAAGTGDRLCFIIEDMQWIDPTSVRLIEQLAQEVSPLVILLSSRTPVQQLNVEEITELRLENLSREEVREGMCNWLDVKEIPDKALTAVMEKSNGHPLFATELAKLMEAEKMIIVENRTCKLSKKAQEGTFGLPDTISALMTSKLDRLPPSQQLALKVAAVIGTDFQKNELVALMPKTDNEVGEKDDDHKTLNQDIASLVQAGLLSRDPNMMYHYRFTNAMLRESAYNLLLFQKRKDLHHKLAEFHEDRNKEYLEPVYFLLATNYYLAEVYDKAVLYSELAGNDALDVHGMQQVLICFSRLLEMDRRHPEVTQHIPKVQKVAWHRKVGEALLHLGKYQDAEEFFKLALTEIDLCNKNAPIEHTRCFFPRQRRLQLVKKMPAFQKMVDNNEAELMLEAANAFELLGKINNDRGSHEALEYRLNALDLARVADRYLRTVSTEDEKTEEIKELAMAELSRSYAHAALFYICIGSPGMEEVARDHIKTASLLVDQVKDSETQALVHLKSSEFSAMVGELKQATDGVRKALWVCQFLSYERMNLECQELAVTIATFLGELGKAKKMLQQSVERMPVASPNYMVLALTARVSLFVCDFETAEASLERIARLDKGGFRKDYLRASQRLLQSEMPETLLAVALLLVRKYGRNDIAISAVIRGTEKLLESNLSDLPLGSFHTAAFLLTAFAECLAGVPLKYKKKGAEGPGGSAVAASQGGSAASASGIGSPLSPAVMNPRSKEHRLSFSQVVPVDTEGDAPPPSSKAIKKNARKHLKQVMSLLEKYAKVYKPCRPHYTYCQGLYKKILSGKTDIKTFLKASEEADMANTTYIRALSLFEIGLVDNQYMSLAISSFYDCMSDKPKPSANSPTNTNGRPPLGNDAPYELRLLELQNRL